MIALPSNNAADRFGTSTPMRFDGDNPAEAMIVESDRLSSDLLLQGGNRRNKSDRRAY
jgi:hypothetical protein